MKFGNPRYRSSNMEILLFLQREAIRRDLAQSNATRYIKASQALYHIHMNILNMNFPFFFRFVFFSADRTWGAALHVPPPAARHPPIRFHTIWAEVALPGGCPHAKPRELQHPPLCRPVRPRAPSFFRLLQQPEGAGIPQALNAFQPHMGNDIKTVTAIIDRLNTLNLPKSSHWTLTGSMNLLCQ